MRRKIILGVVGFLAVCLVVGGYYTFRWWDSSTHDVTTDNALVSGDVVQVAPLNGGRVAGVNVDVGDSVRQGESVATIDVAVPAVAPAAATATGQLTSGLATIDVVSPLDGVVIARRTAAGSTVSALQPIISVVDLGKLWITANIDEGQIARVKIGQPASVHVDSVDRDFEGNVTAIVPASAAALAATPANNATADYTKIGQLVPVRIAIDYAGARLMPGTSAEVDIKVD